MQEVFFLADTHFGHGDKVLRFRPQFKSGEEHDAYIVSRINSVVNPTDTLVLAGDIVITEIGYESLRKLNCRNIILVPGNHDGERTPIPHDLLKKVVGTYGFELKYSKEQRLGCVVTHIPIHPSCLDRWDLNIHGHLHDESIIDPRYVCVSCEQVNYTPVSKVELKLKFDWRYEEIKSLK
jgi:calcineurin-like phosphoesterase family protein